MASNRRVGITWTLDERYARSLPCAGKQDSIVGVSTSRRLRNEVMRAQPVDGRYTHASCAIGNRSLSLMRDSESPDVLQKAHMSFRKLCIDYSAEVRGRYGLVRAVPYRMKLEASSVCLVRVK